jgi:hypothetical protein
VITRGNLAFTGLGLWLTTVTSLAVGLECIVLMFMAVNV